VADKSVKLSTSSFREVPICDELTLRTAEEVVDYLVKVESKRTDRTEPDEEREVKVEYRTASRDINAGIESLAGIKERSVVLITKCLSPAGVCQLQKIPGLTAINKQYSELVQLNGRHGGLTDIVNQAKIAQYVPTDLVNSRGSFRMAKKTKNDYVKLTVGTGVDLCHMVVLGIGMVLRNTEEVDLVGISGCMEREVGMFVRYIRDRAIMMDAYWRVMLERLKDEGKEVK